MFAGAPSGLLSCLAVAGQGPKLKAPSPCPCRPGKIPSSPAPHPAVGPGAQPACRRLSSPNSSATAYGGRSSPPPYPGSSPRNPAASEFVCSALPSWRRTRTRPTHDGTGLHSLSHLRRPPLSAHASTRNPGDVTSFAPPVAPEGSQTHLTASGSLDSRCMPASPSNRSFHPEAVP